MDSLEFSLDPLRQIYNDLNGPQQQTLQDVVAAYRRIGSGSGYFGQAQALERTDQQIIRSRAQQMKLYLSEVFQSTMSEIQRSQDVEVKRVAAEKLLFLINEQVEGVSQQAAFNVIELMGCTQQMSVKQISYTLAPYVLKQTHEGPEEAI